jgi:repressor LexA
MALEQVSEIQRKIYEYIANYIDAEGMPPTNREIGRALGITSTGHVDHHLSMLEKLGWITREPKKARGIKLAKRPTGIPIVGTIAAGEPLDIFPDVLEWLPMERSRLDENAFELVVRGQSMIEDYICDGDYVVIKPESIYQDGDILVATHLLGGVDGSATLKRIFQEQEHGRVRLQPSNPQMEPIFVPMSEWKREWSVQGKVIAILRRCD